MSLVRKFAVSAGGAGGNTLTNSLEFDRADSAYLQRSMSESNRDLWTLSMWVKKTQDNILHHVFVAAQDSDDFSTVRFDSSNRIEVSTSKNGSTAAYVYTTATYTAASGWFHLCIVFDLSESASDRIKIYTNGNLKALTVSTAASATSTDHYWNSANTHNIGVRNRSGSLDNYMDALVADVIFVDNQALAPTNFGYDNGGSWEWKDYTGTYGTNGFRLLFDDATSTTTLGYDASPNGNNWTLNNLATTDQKTDIPA